MVVRGLEILVESRHGFIGERLRIIIILLTHIHLIRIFAIGRHHGHALMARGVVGAIALPRRGIVVDMDNEQTGIWE